MHIVWTYFVSQLLHLVVGSVSNITMKCYRQLETSTSMTSISPVSTVVSIETLSGRQSKAFHDLKRVLAMIDGGVRDGLAWDVVHFVYSVVQD